MQNRSRIAVIVGAVIAAIFICVAAVMHRSQPPVAPAEMVHIPPAVDATPLPYANESPSAAAASSSVTQPTPAAAGLIIHVAGAVHHPSVYTVPMNTRVFQAIHDAGGALPNADMDAVNLAEPLRDGEKVYIPTKGEQIASIDPGSTGNELGRHSDVPGAEAGTGKSAKHGSSAAHVDKLTAGSGVKIDINTASADQLQRIPGVGPSMAARIISSRETLGRFRKPSDLTNVNGVGPKKLSKMLPFVKV